METLILGWYILVETGSVLWLTAFASLQFLGTLVAPFFGVISDRVGRRRMLCAMRGLYGALAATLMTLGLTDLLTPPHVFAIAVLAGLVRPSDLVMRNSLIGDTMPSERLMSAMGLSRTSMDSARIFGAIAGAGLFSLLGLGWAYVFVVCFYGASLCLTLGVSSRRPGQEGEATPSIRDGRRLERVFGPAPWREFKQGLIYVWNTPKVLAVMWLAFLINLTAFPITHGLLPYVARDIYLIDENGLGHLLAAYATGSLCGSLMMALGGGPRRPARFVLVNLLIWYALIVVFGQIESKYSGLAILLAIGLTQSIAMISLSVTLPSTVGHEFRARVMGVRMLCVYGLPVGLLASGLVIGWFGYPVTVAIYSAVGVAFTALITFKWRRQIQS